MLLVVVWPHPGRAHLRLHQRLPRRGELDRDGRLDAGAVAGQGGDLGGVLQFRRGVHLRHRRRQDGRHGHDRHQQSSRFAVDLRRAGRRDHLGPDHLVLRAADELVARADRRLRRRRGGEGGVRRDHPGRLDQDDHLHRAVAAHRACCRPGADDVDLLDLPVDAAGRVDRWFRRLQLLSAAAFSLSHGANDAQKTMGIIAGVLFTAGYIDDVLHSVLGRSWRRTRPSGSARWPAAGGSSTRWDRRSRSCSRSAASRPRRARPSRSSSATHLGVPVSTTHAITGAIVGVGATRRLSAVRWGVAGQIVWAWMLTIPAAVRRSPR